MIYLDNAATGGYKPQSVMDEVMWALKYPANPTRSGHKRAIEMGEKVFRLRQLVCKLFEFDHPERVIFTKNCTESLNLAIMGTIKVGGHVITSENEHNSVLRPLKHLQNLGAIELSILPISDDRLTVSFEQVKSAIRPNTYLVALNHASNVTGAVTEIAQVGDYLKNTDIIFLVDGAQSAGYIDISMKNIDLLALPAHKGLSSPTGLGFLLASEKVELTPILFGGTGILSESLVQPKGFPEGFEAGTLPAMAISGGVGGLSYVISNKDKIRQKMTYFKEILYGTKLPKRIKIFSVPNELGIFSFLIDGLSSSDIANELDERYDVAIRAGLTCAPLVHKHLGTTLTGVARASFSSFNRPVDVEYFFQCLEKL